MPTERAADAASVVGAIQGLLREAASLAAQLAEQTGLQPSDVRALRALDLLADGPLTAGELSASLGLSSAAVSGLLDRLEAAGLARRAPHPSDRRRVHVELTEEARRFGEASLGPMRARITAAIGEASDRELAAAARFLARVVPSDRAGGPAPPRPGPGGPS